MVAMNTDPKLTHTQASKAVPLPSQGDRYRSQKQKFKFLKQNRHNVTIQWYFGDRLGLG
jgi:hypothetical protein